MIGRLTEGDRTGWAELWRDYLAFYKTALPPEQFEHTWQRIMAGGVLNGFGLRLDGELVGIVHYIFHESAWTMTPVCYLQDLFVAQAARGTGGGRKLIEAVAGAAREAGTTKMFWLTQTDNATARLLYDRLARHTGFIRYDYML